MARIVMFGRSGSGKSWLFGWLLERAVPNFDFAVHFDIEDEEVGLSQQGRALFKTFYVDKEFLEESVEYKGREMGLVEAVIVENRHVRVVPDGLKTSEKRDLFARIAGLAVKLTKNAEANMWVSADEAHQVVSEDGIDDRVERMISGGRKMGLEWGFATQRPAKLHEEAFTQANYGYYLSLTKDNDLGKVNNSIGINAFGTLDELKPREFILEDLDSGEIKRHTSDNLSRENEHYAPDDGAADDVAEAAAEGGEKLSELGGGDDDADGTEA